MLLYACESRVSFDFDNDDSRQLGVSFECESMPEGCEIQLPPTWAPGNEDYFT